MSSRKKDTPRDMSFGQIFRLTIFLFCAICLIPLCLSAQQQWAEGIFKLPMEAQWDGVELKPGEYSFKVVTLAQTKWAVHVDRRKEHKTFIVGRREWVRNRKLYPRLVLHMFKDEQAEVAEMELPTYGYVLKFQCRHKNKEGPKAPLRASVPLLRRK